MARRIHRRLQPRITDALASDDFCGLKNRKNLLLQRKNLFRILLGGVNHTGNSSPSQCSDGIEILQSAINLLDTELS